MREITFTVSDEWTLKLRPVSTFKVRAINSQFNKSKPMPPLKKFDNGNGTMIEDYNERDVVYLHCKEIWETEQNDAIAKYVLVAGVADNPPQSFVSDHLAMFPDEEEDDIKLYWLTIMPPEKLTELIGLLTGQSNVTQEGLKQAAETFRSEG